MSRKLTFSWIGLSVFLVGAFTLLPSNVSADTRVEVVVQPNGDWDELENLFPNNGSYNCGIYVSKTTFPNTAGAATHGPYNCATAYSDPANQTPLGTNIGTYWTSQVGALTADTYYVAVKILNGMSTVDIWYAEMEYNGSTWDEDPVIQPPTTEFNEVLDYIYEPDLNNTFGTSTVGADFSIAEPTWVSYVGVRLRDPNGATVWNATTSTAVAGLYSVETDYYFDTTGVYELQAYFNQDGIGLVNNPVSLLITVNVPTWTFDPVTGDLVPSASTTVATSSLLDFKVECDTGSIITDGACKLITAFFVPKASTIQNVQVAFNSVMQKAPFSFFTQSKTVLDAFRLGTASSGGTFSLTFYGETIPIVSSTTATNVGLTSDIIDFFKMIMTVGLWLMLAWYLYWRIASIFGV